MVRHVRVAVVTESFLPQVNGVTNSVLRVVEHLTARGHSPTVVAPGDGPEEYAGAPVVRTPSVGLPAYREFRVGRPWARLASALREIRPDVVHLASPTVLGAQAAAVARRLGVPTVAIYQTDLAGFAARYGLRATERAVWRWLRHVHDLAGRTLAPSRHAVTELRRHGVPRVDRWPRGVDLQRFSPAHRDPALRERLAPRGELVVGYVGRLAAEKQVGLLGALDGVPGIRVVVVGDGPQRPHLERDLPRATFLGHLGGAELAAAYASLDVFVHTGTHETFCQAAQEALASGVPVVAPAAGGLPDLVAPGRTGRLYEPGSAPALRAAVGRVATDPEGRAAMARRARPSVAGRSWAVLGDDLLRHYREVCAR